MAENEYGSNVEELDELFDMDEEKKKKMAGIKNRLKMPNPDVPGDTRTIRALYYQNNGQTSAYKKVSGDKFKTPAIFLNVEEVNAPGIQKDMQCPKTLYQSITRELTNRGLKFKDLPGKVMTVTADYWTSAPKSKRSIVCPKCQGKGCDFCTVTGSGEDAGVMTGKRPPVRYDAIFRDDLMSTTATATKKAGQF